MIVKDVPAENSAVSEQDALSFANELDEVHHFIEQGLLLEKVVMRIPLRDFSRLQKEHPTLFPVEVYQNPSQFQVFAVTFIRAKKSSPGHAKMKVYVEMTGRRLLKIFATS
ncbi:MAG: hypothetical protein RBG13Loki_3059 [Promethearchaeota archaeon CR_4]|nr:MAG: hypothetical protein RBG13Loki_3059 [Candidatus Lokiarchaeota archaeon CR_4]